MELTQAEPSKLILIYDNGQTLELDIKALHHFLLKSQPGGNDEEKKILEMTLEYTKTNPTLVAPDAPSDSAKQTHKRRSYHFDDERDRGPDGAYLKLMG